MSSSWYNVDGVILMTEMGSGNMHGSHGGGPHHTPGEKMRPVATLVGIGLAIAAIVVVVLLAT